MTAKGSGRKAEGKRIRGRFKIPFPLVCGFCKALSLLR
jgi:hypothetical protein